MALLLLLGEINSQISLQEETFHQKRNVRTKFEKGENSGTVMHIFKRKRRRKEEGHKYEERQQARQGRHKAGHSGLAWGKSATWANNTFQENMANCYNYLIYTKGLLTVKYNFDDEKPHIYYSTLTASQTSVRRNESFQGEEERSSARQDTAGCFRLPY